MSHFTRRGPLVLADLDGDHAPAAIHRRNGRMVATTSEPAEPTSDNHGHEFAERLRQRLGDWYTSFLFAQMTTAVEMPHSPFGSFWCALFLLSAVINALAACPDGLTRNQLRQRLGGRVTGKDIDDTLATLREFELVQSKFRGEKEFLVLAASSDPNQLEAKT